MPLPSGTLSMSRVNSEISQPPSSIISLGSNSVRRVAASITGPSVLTGPVSMSQVRGGSATDVITGGRGGSVQVNAQGFVASGYSSVTTTVDGFSVPPIGSWFPVIPWSNFLGGGLISRLYAYSTFSGTQVFLTVSGTPNWTGSLFLWVSNIAGDTWPSGPNGPITLNWRPDKAPFTWWTQSAFGYDFDFSTLRSFRIQKAA